jgi:NAD(P)H-hydrate repair Nnr-like enzyme with NAD(P)H-hydrate dehydratase domain
MEHTFWHKQSKNKPLFPDLIWNRPENRMYAGKLLVIGGNVHGFNAPASAYGAAEKAGVGVGRVMLPDALSKIVGSLVPEAEFAPSTQSGSFSQQALAEMLSASAWADGVLLAGNFGKNSETALLVESYIQKYEGGLTLTGDSIDFFFTNPGALLNRAQTTLVLEFSQLQKLAVERKFPTAFTSSMDLLRLVDAAHEFTLHHQAYVVIPFADTMVVAVNGEVSTTSNVPLDLTTAASKLSVWWLQNPSKPFEALSTALST